MNRKLLYFSSAGSGGLADYAHEQAQALGKLDVDVTLLTPPLYEKESPFYKLKPSLNTSQVSPASPSWMRKAALSQTIISNYSTLAGVIQQEKFQHILLGSYAEYLSLLWFSPLRKLSKQEVIFGAVVHDPVRDYVVGPKWWHRQSIAAAYSFLREAFVHEAIALDTVKPMPQLHTTVIPHGPYQFAAPTQTRDSVLSNLKIPQSAKVLLSFGHIRDGKNLDLVLKAIATFPNLYLIVAGKPAASSQRPASFYQGLANQLGIADRCRWLIDYIPEDQIGNLFTACDAALLTYSANFQSASGVLNAAVTYRRPCIASSGQGNLRTMVQRYQLGIFVEPDDWRAIQSGIQQWLDRPVSPQWEAYERDNSWQRNAEIVRDRLWAKPGESP